MSSRAVSGASLYRAPAPDPKFHSPANRTSICCPRHFHPVTNFLSGCDYLKKLGAPHLNPALTRSEAELAPLREKVLAQERVKGIAIATYDGARLSGVFRQAKEGWPGKAAILLVLGRDNCWEDMGKDGSDGSDPFISAKLAQFLQREVCLDDVDLLVVNIRGVGKSVGDPSYDGWTTDVYSSLQYLSSLGYSRIGAYGYSAGGWLCVQPVYWLQQELAERDPGSQAVLITDRAPTDLALATYYYVRYHVKNESFKGSKHEAMLQRSGLLSVMGWGASHLAYFAMRVSEWSAPVERDLQAMPPQAVLSISVNGDEFVHEHAATPSHIAFNAPEGVTRHTCNFPEEINLGPRIREMLGLAKVVSVAQKALAADASS